MMRILYLSSDFGIPVRGFKGASVHIRELTDALTDLGHEVIVLTPNVGEGNSTRAEVRIVTAPRLPEPLVRALRRVGAPWGRGKQLEREVRELWYNVTLVHAAEALVAEWRPDMIYERYSLFGLAGGALARRLRLPHLLEVNAPLRQERQRVQGLALDLPARLAERHIFSAAGRILCVSRAVADYVIAHGGRTGTIQVQPNAVDGAKIHPNALNVALRTQLGFTNDDVVVGFVGSLKPWHGVEGLTQALASAQSLAPQLRLLVVGDGPARPHIEQVIAELRLNDSVRLVGNVAHSDVPAYLAAMDAAAAPYEDMVDFYFSPLKVFEYMAAGLPVIAPRLGQISELITDGVDGLLYTPGSVPELSSELARLAEDAALRVRLGACAAARVSAHHTWRETARRVVSLGQYSPR